MKTTPLTIPMMLAADLALAAAASPRAWNTRITNVDLKDRDCGGVSVIELRSRSKKNAQGELEMTFKVTTFTKPGHDKKATVTIEVLASDRVPAATSSCRST